MRRTGLALGLAGAALMALPAAALAHTGHMEPGGFMHGFEHPLGGLDHLLAMVAVGLWAAQSGGRALLALPAAFVGAMILGGLAGMAGLPLPAVELGILGSVLALGALVAFQPKLSVASACDHGGFRGVPWLCPRRGDACGRLALDLWSWLRCRDGAAACGRYRPDP